MEIRQATPEDVSAIRSIATDSWEADYPDLISRETIDDGVEEWYDSDQLRREIETGDALFLLGVQTGDDERDRGPGIVAFAHAVLPDDGENTGHLLRLYVHPDERRQGIGNELLEATVDRLDERGVDTLRAMVLSANETGKAFYRDHGFEAVETATTTIGGESHEETTFERRVTARANPP